MMHGFSMLKHIATDMPSAGEPEPQVYFSHVTFSRFN